MSDGECIDRPMNRERTLRGVSRAGVESVAGADWAIGEIAGRQHGVVARWQLSASGLTRDAIDGRIRRGVLRRLHRGVYAVGHLAMTTESRWMAAVLACGPGAVLSHRPAGQLWRLLPRSPHLPEVMRPGHHRRRTGIVTHRSALPEDEVTVILGIPVTAVFRTLFDLAGVLSLRQLERALHEAEVRQLTAAVSLPALLGRYPRRPGSANLRALLKARAPVGVTQNEFEELFVAFLDAHELPRPQFNAMLALRGRFFKPDCLWREERLIVELDGRAAHRTSQAFESDRQRDRVLLAEGWRSMRVTWRQLHDEPTSVAADLRQLLRARASPPTL